jgi:hypothetical protein
MLQRPSHARQEARRARDRRHKERVKAGRICVVVELGHAELDWLVRIGWVTRDEADQGDSHIVGEAIARGLAVSAKG